MSRKTLGVVLGCVALLGGAALVGAGVAGFLYYKRTRPTPIGEVQRDLRRWDGRVVTVRGQAEDVVKLGNLRAYRLRDDSGVIRVVTKRGLPRPGDIVTVTGTVQQLFQVEGSEYTVILEPPADEGGAGS